MDDYPVHPPRGQAPRQPARSGGHPWPPPHASTRVSPPYFSHAYIPPQPPPPPPLPKRNRGPLIASLIAIAALVLGSVAFAISNRSGTTAAAPTTTLPIDSEPATDPSTNAPLTQAPATDSPATETPTTQAPSTDPATDPAPAPETIPVAPANPNDPTASSSGGTTTSKDSSLSVGVVDIVTVLKYDQAEAAGTGMVLTADGVILTNNHVIQGSTSISVTVVATGRTYSASVVGTDATSDVAVLRLKNATGLAVAKIGDSSTVKVGDAVVGVGNAGGKGGAPTIAAGSVTDLNQSITATDETGAEPEQLTGLIQVDAALQPGESGGPLYNAAGEIIGMDTAGSSTTRRSTAVEGYAIPINTALSIADDIRAGKDTATITIGVPSFLGIGATDAPNGGGAVVSGVVSGSPADKIGLATGDTITAVDGTTVTNEKALGPLLHVHKAGEKASITWTDVNGASHTADATLITGPAD